MEGSNNNGDGWLRRFAAEYRWSLIFVGLPTLLSAIYFFLFASEMYASEARFVVRTPSHSQTFGLASLLQGSTSGIARAQDDVYTVYDFITSRDALTQLEKQVDLHAIFSRPEADFLARYPNPIFHGHAEDFYKYYKTRVLVSYDSVTGISTLTVKAFRAEDAQRVADVLLQESEDLINRLNQRAHDNAVHDAEMDVHLAEERVTEAQQHLLEYRQRETLLDPNRSSGAMFDTLTRMQAELSGTRARMADLDRTSPSSPLRSSLQAQADALESQIASQRLRLAGGDGSMAPKISEYERLMLQQDFAARELTSALASLESSREAARRQNMYIDRVVEPNRPDKAEFPKRIRMVLTIFAGCLMAYSIVKMLIAGVREHAQA